MAKKLPYIVTPGNIQRALDRIKVAATPERFTDDFVSAKLGIKGAASKMPIPYLKRLGFIGTDGVPTDLYNRFRNNALTGQAAAEALRIGYRSLYEMNEHAHDLSDKEFRGLVMEATGLAKSSRVLQLIVQSFNAVKKFADFEAQTPPLQETTQQVPSEDKVAITDAVTQAAPAKFGLSYTINLNLPATPDIAVFNAIFKSLRDNLLR